MNLKLLRRLLGTGYVVRIRPVGRRRRTDEPMDDFWRLERSLDPGDARERPDGSATNASG